LSGRSLFKTQVKMIIMKTGNKKQIDKTLAVLRQGGVVVYPTETAYGLGTDATNSHGVARLASIKRRSINAPFSIIVSSLAMAEQYCQFSAAARRIVNEHWPGPLTIIAGTKSINGLSEHCVRHRTVALRISSHPVADMLVRRLSRALIATSANISGQPTCYSINTVRRQFKKQLLQPDYYLDHGVLPRRKPSTIISISGGQVKVVRQGGVRI